MSNLGVPYIPYTLIWTKKILDEFFSVYPTYLPIKLGHFFYQSLSHFSIEGVLG